MEFSAFEKKKTVIKIGEKEYTFKEISIRDLVSFKNYLIGKKKEANKSRQEEILSLAKSLENVDSMQLLKLLDSSISDSEFDEQMATIEGIGYLAWQSLKYTYDNVTLDNVMDMITPEHINEIQEALFPSDENKKKSQKNLNQKTSPSQEE